MDRSSKSRREVVEKSLNNRGNIVESRRQVMEKSSNSIGIVVEK